MSTRIIPPEPILPSDTEKQQEAKRKAWDDYHKEDRAKGRDLADALCALSTFRADVKAYLAAKEAIELTRYEIQRGAGAGTPRWLAAGEAAVEQQFNLEQRALPWLEYRYVAIAQDGCKQLHMPYSWLRDVIWHIRCTAPYRIPLGHVMINGPAYDTTIQYDNGRRAIRFKIDAIITTSFYLRETQTSGATLIRSLDDVTNYQRLWRGYKYDEHDLHGLLMPWPAKGLSRELYKALVCRTIDAYWPEIGSGPVDEPKNPGVRRKARPTGARGGVTGGHPYTDTAKLCNLWAKHPAEWEKRPDLAHYWRDAAAKVTWNTFAALTVSRGIYTGGVDPTGRVSRSLENRVESATKKALDWGMPTPGVATSLETFSLTDPVPAEVADFAEKIRASTQI